MAGGIWMTRNNVIFCSLILALSLGPDVIAAQSDREPTADSQKNNKTDVSTTAKIRRALMHDKSLSTAAHNITIITQNGNVTLRGKVKSEDERQRVLGIAHEIAGDGSVTDALVAPVANQ
jgi:hyperosmotically inducible periplasmic protein